MGDDEDTAKRKGEAQNGQKDDQESSAVATLQRMYRSHRSKREAAGLNLETSRARKRSTNTEDEQHNPSPITPRTRWDDAMTTGGLIAAGKEQEKGLNDAQSRWKRSGFYAARITGSNGQQEQTTDNSSTAHEKIAAMAPNKAMEAQYWLEMVDSKHRYGTNLKSYHDAWNKSDTTQNFFFWLDSGEGKDLNLDDCPREQLDRERVSYLNAEQRKNYLVDIGHDGRLHWHRNGREVDTAKGKWEDLGNGRGVGYKGEKDNMPPPPAPHEEFSSSSSSSESSLYSASDSDVEAGEMGKKHHYRSKPDKGDQSTRKYLTSRKAVMDLLLRKTINSNTWIFVMTTKHQLYVGIKSTGGFQHSSFMYGATVAAAGLLKVKEGQLTSLSPLSGHYRAGTMHFKAFCRILEEKGVDMSKVSISKSLVVIGGVEKYGKFSKKKKSAKAKLREKLHIRPNKEQRQAEEREARDKDIEKKARIDARSKDRDPAEKADSSSSSSSDDDDRQSIVTANLHEGKKPEQMTDLERAERAVALIQSAVSKGLKGEKKRIEQDARKEE